MRYFFATAAFMLLIIQFVLIFDALGDVGSPDRTTSVAGFVIVLINLIGVFFNVKTLRSSLSNERREL